MRPFCLLLAALFLSSCDEPPVKEIAAAEAALAQARKDEADRYAEDRLKEADAALAQARTKVQAKDYRGALSAATDAAEKARSASLAAAAAKTVARSATGVAHAEIQAVLDEVAKIREEAVQAKVPTEAFAEVAPLMEQAKQGLEAVAKTLEGGDLLGARKAVMDLKTQIAPLPGLVRDAQAKWEAAHPKRGRAAAKKR